MTSRRCDANASHVRHKYLATFLDTRLNANAQGMYTTLVCLHPVLTTGAPGFPGAFFIERIISMLYWNQKRHHRFLSSDDRAIYIEEMTSLLCLILHYYCANNCFSSRFHGLLLTFRNSRGNRSFSLHPIKHAILHVSLVC